MMCVKTKILKRVMSVVCAVTIAASIAVTPASAGDKTDAQMFARSLHYLEKVLPKPGDSNFDQFTSLKYLEEPDELKEEKTYPNVKYPKDETDTPEIRLENVTIKEKETYKKIEKLVESLEKKVDERTPGNPKYTGPASKHAKDMSREMRIAKAIYRWVAKKIPYDNDSLKRGIDPNGSKEKVSLRKPQDPLFVFDRRIGICAGKASLVNLMMRIAKIPCAVINTQNHAFNVVYFEDKKGNRKGWTLLDATWAAPESDMKAQIGDKIDEKEDKMKKFFPAFYQKSIDFRTANIGMMKVGEHNIWHVLSRVRDNDVDVSNYRKIDPYYDYYNKIVENEPVLYRFGGTEQGDYVRIEPKNLEKGKYLEGIKLSPDVLQNGVKVKIDGGIKSFVLKGDIYVDFDLRDAEDLESINTEESTKCISDKFALYERNNSKPNKRGKLIATLNGLKEHTIQDIGENGLRYSYSLDCNTKELEYISLSGEKLIEDAVKIPELLREANVPIKIGFGIKSLILEGDDIVDLSEAWSLTTIDVTRSNKYMFEDNVLYEKKADGQKGNVVPRFDPNDNKTEPLESDDFFKNFNFNKNFS